MPAKSKKKLRTVGQLRPECIYNADGLKRFMGIGWRTLKEAREAGVEPRLVGTRMVYLGKDIIDWIFKK